MELSRVSCRLGVGAGGELVGGEVAVAGAEHGEDDVAAAAGEADEGGVVALALGAFAVVVVARVGTRERRERGQEEGVLEAVVAASAAVFAADAGPGLSGDRSEAGVGGELGAAGERRAISDLSEDPCSGPGADPRQADQDRSERV